jgi:hypothetical protein
MKIALVIFPNQNEVSKSEIEKIRRTVKKDFPAASLNVYANEKAESLIDRETGFPDVKEDQFMVFETTDVNNSIVARIDQNRSTLSGDNCWYIQLN